MTFQAQCKQQNPDQKSQQSTWLAEAYSDIENFINEFEEVLFGNNFKDPENGYRSYIDIDSFIDWYLINEIGKSVDTYGYASVFFNYSFRCQW